MRFDGRFGPSNPNVHGYLRLRASQGWLGSRLEPGRFEGRFGVSTCAESVSLDTGRGRWVGGRSAEVDAEWTCVAVQVEHGGRDAREGVG